ncbi:MAG: 4-hydroxybenzoate octaprenyltransferase [Pseudomonadota bacterium]
MQNNKAIDAQSDWISNWPILSMRPYLRLARADRPIGIWLLLWPCWWSVMLAGGSGSLLYDLWTLTLFAIGATVMRAAGCAYNDIIDRNIDAKVKRTQNRPIPSGDISVRQATLFLVLCSLIGLLVLIQFNTFTIILGISSLGIVAIYPFMKRITYWPQSVLGLAFSWGALMGWSSITSYLDLAPIALYIATVFWTIGYDTIYAHQDKEDDALLGLKSTALRFGESTKYWLSCFYMIVIVMLAIAGFLVGSGIIFMIGLGAASLNLVWQIKTLDINDTENCLQRFRSNRDFGALVFISFAFHYFTIS